MGALLGNLISFVCESNSFVISVRRLPTSYFFSSEITLSSTLGARKAYGIQWDSRNWYKSGTEDSNSLSGSLWLEETSEMIQFSSVQSLSHVWLYVTPWTSLSVEYSKQEYWSGLPCPPPRGPSWPRDQTQVSSLASRLFTIWATREASCYILVTIKLFENK